MMKRLIAFALKLFISLPTYACLQQDLWVKGIQVKPISHNVILNGSSIEMLQISSNLCGIQCYMEFLNQKNIHFSKQGALFFIEKRGGITIHLFETTANKFSGRMTCKANKEFRKINLPEYLKRYKPSTDLQVSDKNSISRTLVYPNFKSENYMSLLKKLKGRSASSDINTAYAYFEINNGDEVNLLFDNKKKIGNLVIIYIHKRITS